MKPPLLPPLLLLLLLLLYLSVSCLSMKICKSILLTQGSFERHRNTSRLHEELSSRVSGCQYIHGDLTIMNIGASPSSEAPIPDDNLRGHVREMRTDFLDSIQEISGRLLIIRVNLRVLRLANLRAIRGHNLLGESPFHPFELRQSPYPMELQLPGLAAILQGSALLNGRLHESLYCRLKHSVDWPDLFKADKQKLIDSVSEIVSADSNDTELLNKSYACRSADQLTKGCDLSCPLADASGRRFCWSAGPDGCQSSSRCDGRTSNCRSCYREAGQARCCDTYCLGGCSSGSRSACYSCRDVLLNGECASACPSDYDPGKGILVNKNDSTLQVGNVCVRTCPSTFLKSSDGRYCLSECQLPVPGDRLGELPIGGTCRPCQVEPDCRTCRVSTAILTNEEVARLLASGCPVWRTLDLQPNLDANAKMLSPAGPGLRVLGQLRYLYGGLMVRRATDGLDFLANLTFVSGQLMLVQIRARYLALASLESAMLLYLYQVEGLCPAWFPSARVAELNDRFPITKKSVSFDNSSSECAAARCHPQCANGCWGPGNRLCVACRRYRVGDACYASCDEAHRRTLNATACGEACHPECAQGSGCRGPGAADCVSCRGLSERGVCVSKCGPGLRPDSRGRCYSTAWLAGVCVGVLLLLLLLAALPLAVVYYRRRITLYDAVDIDEFLTDASNPSDMSKLHVINNDDVVKQRVIGSGAFGTVYKGVLRSAGHELPVAVKVLRGRSPKLGQELLKEAGVLARVRHRCCIRLVALCLTQEPQLITVLMPRGCLLDFVRTRRRRIGADRMLRWSLQVAEGMAYLQSEGIVHRDLAARNVLLQTPDQVRITDFGLARLLNISERDFASSGGLLPVKWLGIECIESGIFSHQSDVWSFGVLVWEICTFGESPYCQYGIRHVDDMLSLLNKGIRLGQPDVCSVDFYNTLLTCWLPYPESRPTFVELIDILGDCLKTPERYIAYSGNLAAGGIAATLRGGTIGDAVADHQSANDDSRVDGDETESTIAAGVGTAAADAAAAVEAAAPAAAEMSNSYIADPISLVSQQEKLAQLPLATDGRWNNYNDEDDGYMVPCLGQQLQPLTQQQQQPTSDCESDHEPSSVLLPGRRK